MNEFEERIRDDPEQRVDRVLRALGGAEPTAGLQDRVLAALDGRVLEQRASRPVAARRWTWGWAGAVVLACVAVLLLLIAGVRRKGAPVPSPEQVGVVARGSEPASSAPVVNAAPTPSAAHLPVTAGTWPHARLTLNRPQPVNEFAAAEAPEPSSVPSAAELDRQALADFRAPSQPAPPLPPTAEERQVRLMLRRGEQHDLAQLDPASVSAYFDQERTAFRSFFDPPSDPHIADQPRSLADAQHASPNPEGDTPR